MKDFINFLKLLIPIYGLIIVSKSFLDIRDEHIGIELIRFIIGFLYLLSHIYICAYIINMLKYLT